MSTTQQSFLYSVLFHIVVVLLLMLVKFTPPEINIPEYIEIIMPEQVLQTPRPATPSSPPPASSENTTPEPTTSSPPPQQIDTPQVTNEYDDFDLSSLPDRTDRPPVVGNATSENIENLTPDINPQTPNTQQPTPNTTTQGTGINTEGLSNEIRNAAGNISGFQLGGDVVNRTIITRALPEFPAGIRRNGSVTLQFTVVEDGSVRNISISRTSGVPEFDNLSTEAMRQWVFNRSDRSHTGQITFNFRLE